MEKKIRMPLPRQTKAQAVLMGCGLIGGVAGCVWGVARTLGVSLPSPVVATTLLVLIAGLTAGSFYHWRLIDEAAREAHKFAWFWGGSSALALALPVMLLIDEATLESLLGAHDPRYWVATGVLAVVLIQVAGYGLAWAGWWLVRQR